MQVSRVFGVHVEYNRYGTKIRPNQNPQWLSLSTRQLKNIKNRFFSLALTISLFFFLLCKYNIMSIYAVTDYYRDSSWPFFQQCNNLCSLFTVEIWNEHQQRSSKYRQFYYMPFRSKRFILIGSSVYCLFLIQFPRHRQSINLALVQITRIDWVNSWLTLNWNSNSNKVQTYGNCIKLNVISLRCELIVYNSKLNVLDKSLSLFLYVPLFSCRNWNWLTGWIQPTNYTFENKFQLLEIERKMRRHAIEIKTCRQWKSDSAKIITEIIKTVKLIGIHWMA